MDSFVALVLSLQPEGGTTPSTGEQACLPNPRLRESSLQPVTHVGGPGSISDVLDTFQLSSEDPYHLEQHIRARNLKLSMWAGHRVLLWGFSS